MNDSDTITPPQSPSATPTSGTPSKPSTVPLHSSLSSIPTSPTSVSLVSKSSSWSNLPLVASGSPRVEGIRIGNNNPSNHETVRNLASIPGYQAFTSALPKTTSAPSPLKIILEPESSPNGPSNFEKTANSHAVQNSLSQSTGSLITSYHTPNANQSSGHTSGNYGSAGSWSNGGSGNYGNMLNTSGGSGNFNGFLNTMEDVEATPKLLKQGIVKALKGTHSTTMLINY
jgi:hypothetical protein